jgi:uncharacterized protein
MTVYLDASALVKLVVPEAESDVLRQFLRRRPEWTSSALASVELRRAARIRGGHSVQTADELLQRLDLIDLGEEVLDRAARLMPRTLRTLYAIHVASAMLLEQELEALVTYDGRMQDAAELHGLPIAAPA